MKLKSDFILHTVGGEHVVMPVGERTQEFHGMIRLNESGAFIWERMTEQGTFTIESLVAALLEHYDVTDSVAAATVEKFIASLTDAGIVEV